jgi:hypothetical protein
MIVSKILKKVQVKKVYASFLGDLFAATRYKYIPVGSLSPSMATEVACKKSPQNAATFTIYI